MFLPNRRAIAQGDCGCNLTLSIVTNGVFAGPKPAEGGAACALGERRSVGADELKMAFLTFAPPHMREPNGAPNGTSNGAPDPSLTRLASNRGNLREIAPTAAPMAHAHSGHSGHATPVRIVRHPRRFPPPAAAAPR